jgi:peptidoglycan/xylan/chitin deacetylase (PgdA/CDA1 family)
MDTYTNAFPVLEKYGLTGTVLLVSGHIGGTNTWDHGEVPITSLLGPSEIREMAERGMGFGSHTVSHKPLTELSYKEARSEIADSKCALEDMLGKEMRALCYPYGRSNPYIREITQEAGYHVACGIEERENTLFNLSRVDAVSCSDNWLLWRMKISGTHYKLRQNSGLRKLKTFLKRSN